MKKKYLKSILWILRLQWQTSRFSFGWTVFGTVFDGLRPIVQTYALAQVISNVSKAAIQKADPEPVYFWLTVLLIVELLSLIFNTIDRIVKDRFQQKIELVLNEHFFKKMYELSQEQFDDEVFNTKLERARDSLFQIWRIVSEISFVVSSFISFVGSLIAIVLSAPLIGLVIALSVIPAALLNMKQNNLREAIYKRIEPIDRVAYRTRWMLIDTASMPEIRLMNAFKKMIKTWRIYMTKSQNIVYENDKKLAKIDVGAQIIQPLIGFGASIYFFKLLLAGTIGLDKFIFLRGMIETASNGADMMANSVKRLHEMTINLQNFNEIYDLKPTIPNGSKKIDRPFTIEFINVSFAYPGTDQLVLDDVSFVIAPGNKLALVGENGAGKSTLIKLLLRQYLPTTGSIVINGTDIKEIDVEHYYSGISNLSQDFLILQHLSIKDNLSMGLSSDPTDEDVYQVTDLVDATKFIQKLPHKLDSRLDPSFSEGTSLSGGQMQRLGVARALLRNGDLMILDEPTSAIDAKGEYAIFNNIYRSHADKTTLIVSHRFSTVRKAESIIVMEQGRITEYGTHEELLEYGGLYKEMFEAQAEGYR